MSVISFYDYLIDNEILKSNVEYSWSLYDNIYTGTVVDFVESVGGDRDKFFFKCEICGNSDERGKSAIINSGLICRMCGKSATLDYSMSLEYLFPDVAKIYSTENSIPARYVKAHSNKKFLFRCDIGHTFTRSLDGVVSSVKKGIKVCPICSGHKVLTGYNDLKTAMPEVLEYWDFEKNSISPDMVSKGSESLYWFKCKKGHSYTTSPCALRRSWRDHKTVRCPYCKGRMVDLGFNDLQTVYPEIAKMWVSELNNCDARDISKGKGGNFWFKCDKNHQFLSTIEHMKRSLSKGLNGCPVCSGRSVIDGNSLYDVFSEIVDDFWDFDLNIDVDCYSISPQSNKNAYWKCVSCGKSYHQPIVNRVRSIGYCSDCVKNMYQSTGELELGRWLSQYVNLVDRYKFGGRGTELDIYIPERNFGIEYNGLYWHSEAVLKGKNDNYNKYLMACSAGISFFCVWEDDWLLKKDIVKMAILRKLGLSEEVRVNARDCKVIKANASSGLLDRFHIQGDLRVGCSYLQLVYNNSVVAEMSYKVNRDGSVYIVRYATSCIVRGGFSKVLSRLESVIDQGMIYTFSDNSVSNGALYKMCGFEKESILNPDYSYLVNGHREHKFNYRKSDFRRSTILKYKDGLTEHELALYNKIYRVYDYGKIRWVKVVNK